MEDSRKIEVLEGAIIELLGNTKYVTESRYGDKIPNNQVIAMACKVINNLKEAGLHDILVKVALISKFNPYGYPGIIAVDALEPEDILKVLKNTHDDVVFRKTIDLVKDQNEREELIVHAVSKQGINVGDEIIESVKTLKALESIELHASWAKDRECARRIRLIMKQA